MKSPVRINRLPLFVSIGIVTLILVVVIGGIVAFQISYSGRALPGVKVQGTDVSGMQPEEIFRVAQAKAAYFRTPALTLHLLDKTVSMRPADFGAGLDPAATTQKALDVGRGGDLFTRLQDQLHIWWGSVDVAPVVLVDDARANAVVSRLSSEVQRAPRNASVAYDTTRGGVIETPAQSGSELDTSASFALIQTAISAGKTVDLRLPINILAPQITSAGVAAEAARALFSQDLVVMLPRWDADDKPLAAEEAFRIKGADLGLFVNIEQQVVNGEVKLNTTMRRDKIAPMLEKLAPAVQRDVQDARFTFDAANVTLENTLPSQAGRTLNVDKTLDAIEAALKGNTRQVALVIDVVQPAINTDATAAKLGITRLITQATTYFKGSSAARMVNVKVAASRFNGVIVAPHETFSFDKYLGDVSTKDGFEEGLVIVGDRTI
ncbi:MAG TPA: peptidoglycan binding domain-containing protein, partial [Anaerolineae bacterium]